LNDNVKYRPNVKYNQPLYKRERVSYCIPKYGFNSFILGIVIFVHYSVHCVVQQNVHGDVQMQLATISMFRKDIKQYIDHVHTNQEPLIVTRSDNVSVVVVSLQTYNELSHISEEQLLKQSQRAKLRQALEQN